MTMPEREILLKLYRDMLLLRRFEEAASQAYRDAKVPGFIHVYIGEEAVAVGVLAHVNQDDYIGSTHRGHGHVLAKGVPPREAMAELFGRSSGCSGGRGGSMHMYSAEHGLLATNGIVGYGIPMAAGAAFSAQYRGTGQVAVAFFGDGAANLGCFHEVLNMAAIWDLPVVFVCENNLYATELPFQAATAGESVAARAGSYDMPGVEVDGQDVLAVYEVARKAVERARSGNGPTLIECRTYRFTPHYVGKQLSEHFAAHWRTEDEVRKWKARDPIQLLAGQLLQGGTATEGELDGIEKEVNSVIQDALEFAAASPWPSPEEAATKVFSNPV
jgi:pyruvate dehydrogenase E1 component alpha subunit